MGGIRQTILDTGNYLCPRCKERVVEEANAVPIPAYEHKTCRGMTPLPPPPPPEKVVDIKKNRMSKEEKEEFERWRKEKQDDNGE